MRDIGLMGGTFNPVHYAHLILAERAYEQHGLDEVVFIPSAFPAYKDTASVADAAHRLAMLQLAVADVPYFSISDIELRREGATYTVDTLRELTALQPDDRFYLIIGGDSLMYIDQWKDAAEILSMCVVLAASRVGLGEDKILDKLRQLRADFECDIRLVRIPDIDISSTQIRERVAGGLSIRYLTPEPVREYIHANGLYGD